MGGARQGDAGLRQVHQMGVFDKLAAVWQNCDALK
jgi:hypothetical protein